MSPAPVTAKSPEQISAAFDEVFKTIVPPVQARLSLADQLRPYGTEVKKLRKRGYTWRQVAAGMADPRIGIKASPNTLQLLFETRKEKASRELRRQRQLSQSTKTEPVAKAPREAI